LRECELTPHRTVSIIDDREKALKELQKSLEQALEEAVSRALRDNLSPLQHTADELQQAYADFVASCGSSRPSNALPAMLRAQAAAASLAAGLAVLSNFVAVALNPRERATSATGEMTVDDAGAAVEAAPEAPRSDSAAITKAAEIPAFESAIEEAVLVEMERSAEAAEAVAMVEAPAFDIGALPIDQRDLHRRANRIAKVAMQDIKLLRPADVRLGCEHKDICDRLRNDLDKARKEYDRRFRAILDHPVDYFHHWMVEILADGNAEALGEYPYPSPVLRH
jgi:hypothetical protein